MVYIYGVPLASSGWHPEHLGTLLANLDSGRAKAFAQPASVTLVCESVVQRSMAYANRVVLQPEHLPIDHADLLEDTMLRVCLRRTVRRKPSNNFDRNVPAP